MKYVTNENTLAKSMWTLDQSYSYVLAKDLAADLFSLYCNNNLHSFMKDSEV